MSPSTNTAAAKSIKNMAVATLFDSNHCNKRDGAAATSVQLMSAIISSAPALRADRARVAAKQARTNTTLRPAPGRAVTGGGQGLTTGHGHGLKAAESDGFK